MVKVRRIGPGLTSVLSLLALWTAGCSRGRDNVQVALAVQNAIRIDGRMVTARVQVRSFNGIVTLSGYVGRRDQRVSAVQDAAQVEGVRVVVDNLRVLDPDPQSPIMAAHPQPKSVAQTASASKVTIILKAGSSHGAWRADSSRRPPLAATVGASSAPDTIASPTNVVSAASVSSDTHPLDSKALGTGADVSPVPAPAAAMPPSPTDQVTVPYGTVLAVRLTESLDSELNQRGDTFLASLASPVMIGDRVVIPAEAGIQGKVVEVRNAGRFSGRSALVIEVTRLAYNGKTYELRSSQYSKQSPSRDTRTVATIGGGAGVGAIIGAILGGGKGAAIGAVIGAGAGTGAQAATKAAQVQLPAESTLSFQLRTALTVAPSSTLQSPQGTGPGSMQDPFSSDDRPVLKRRPGSQPSDTDTNTPNP
jgi:hypothetical protein